MARTAAARAHPSPIRRPAHPVENIDIARLFEEIAELPACRSRQEGAPP